MRFRVAALVFAVLCVLRSGAAQETYTYTPLISGGAGATTPNSLLDNSPLRELLISRIDWDGVHTSIERGHLRGLALSSTCYESGQSIAFFDGVEKINNWARTQRAGRRERLTLDHLMASAAIPASTSAASAASAARTSKSLVPGIFVPRC